MYRYDDKGINGFSQSRLLGAAAQKPEPEPPIPDSGSLSYKEWRDLVVTLLFRELGFANIPYLARLIKRYMPNRTYETIRTTLHRIAKRLEAQGYVRLITTGGLTYLELVKLPPDYTPVDPPKAKVDLIVNHGRRKPRNRRFRIMRYPASYERFLAEPVLWERADVLARDGDRLKFVTGLVRDYFESWFDRVAKRVIVLRDPDTGELLLKRLSSRFTDPRVTAETLFKFRRIYNYYAKTYRVGVFLTLTFPPVLPLGIYPKIASYVLKQLMAWLRKRNKGKKIRIIRVNEFQENGMLHLHVLIFGVGRIADKKELTVRLDKWFVNAIFRLEKLGVPKEIVDLMIARYNRYRRRYKKYQGPLNWVTKVDFVTGRWNPPPDYLRYLKQLEERKKEDQTFRDGGSPDPGDYLSKYMFKFIRVAGGLARGDIEPEKLSLKFLMYWVTGLPFFYTDNRIYKKLGLSRRRETYGYQVIGVFNEYDLPDFIYHEYMMQELGIG